MNTTQPPYLLLYVTSPADSSRFYQGLLNASPVESSPTFALFVLAGGAKLGLWRAPDVEPAATSAGGSEIAFVLDSRDKVDAAHAVLKDAGVRIAQPPTTLDFGYTFVALDPDGHRLRIFHPADRSE